MNQKRFLTSSALSPSLQTVRVAIQNLYSADGGSDWTPSNLQSFLIASSLIDSKSRPEKIVSLLYRFLVALGSFPYHNNPFKYLTFDVLSVAISMIQCKQDPEKYLVNSQYEEAMQQIWLDSVHRRLLFQSIANHGDDGAFCDQTRQRNMEADEDLIQVLGYLSQHKYFEVLGSFKEVIIGPEPPEASQIPSSQSDMLENSISDEDMATIIQFLLTAQLCTFGINPQHFTEHFAKVEEVTQHILKAFTMDHSNQPKGDVDWTTFNYVIEQHSVSIFSLPPCIENY